MADKNLTVKIRGDNAGLSKSLKQSKAGIQKFGGFLKGFGAKFGIISGALVGTGVVAGGLRIFTQAGADVDRLAKLGKSFGLTTEEVQKFERVAKLTGVELDLLLDGFGNLSKSIVTFVRDGTGPGKAVFAELGLSAADLQSAFAKGPVAILATFGEALQKIENPIKRAALVEEVLGTTNKRLGVVLADAAAIFQDVDRIFRKADLGITPGEVQSVEDYNDAWTKVFNTLENKARKFAATVAGKLQPSVEALNTTLENFFEAATKNVRAATAGAIKSVGGALTGIGGDVFSQVMSGNPNVQLVQTLGRQLQVAGGLFGGDLSVEGIRGFFARGLTGAFELLEVPPSFGAKIVAAVRGSGLQEVLPGLEAPRPGTGTINGRRIADILFDVQRQLGSTPPFPGLGGALPAPGTGTINGKSIDKILEESKQQKGFLKTIAENSNFFKNERTGKTIAVAAP